MVRTLSLFCIVTNLAKEIRVSSRISKTTKRRLDIKKEEIKREVVVAEIKITPVIS